MNKGRFWLFWHSGVLPFSTVHPEHPDFPKSTVDSGGEPWCETGMCPHCGAIVQLTDGDLTDYHDWPKPTRQVCPGSKQIYRCAESDARPLWNGKRNPHFGAGEPPMGR